MSKQRSSIGQPPEIDDIWLRRRLCQVASDRNAVKIYDRMAFGNVLYLVATEITPPRADRCHFTGSTVYSISHVGMGNFEKIYCNNEHTHRPTYTDPNTQTPKHPKTRFSLSLNLQF